MALAYEPRRALALAAALCLAAVALAGCISGLSLTGNWYSSRTDIGTTYFYFNADGTYTFKNIHNVPGGSPQYTAANGTYTVSVENGGGMFDDRLSGRVFLTVPDRTRAAPLGGDEGCSFIVERGASNKNLLNLYCSPYSGIPFQQEQ